MLMLPGACVPMSHVHACASHPPLPPSLPRLQTVHVAAVAAKIIRHEWQGAVSLSPKNWKLRTKGWWELDELGPSVRCRLHSAAASFPLWQPQNNPAWQWLSLLPLYWGWAGIPGMARTVLTF